jgi:hypothetical protein
MPFSEIFLSRNATGCKYKETKMSQAQFINTVLDWEKRWEIEDEKRESRRFENIFTDQHTGANEHKSIFARIFGTANRQPAYPCCAPDHSHQAQPG